jgi:hypothetical protein
MLGRSGRLRDVRKVSKGVYFILFEGGIGRVEILVLSYDRIVYMMWKARQSDGLLTRY